jgi:hypothetical protein
MTCELGGLKNIPKFLVLMQVLKICEALVQSTATNSLIKFQELLLIRLQLDAPF